VLEAIASEGMKLEVHVRAETCSATTPELWKVLEGDAVELQSLAAMGHGIDAIATAEGSSPAEGYRIAADLFMPDLTGREWKRRWQVSREAMPDGLESCIHDDDRVASVAGVVSSTSAARQALLALARVSRPHSAEIHWRVRGADVNALSARRLEKIVSGGAGEDGPELEYQIVAAIKPEDLPALARLLVSGRHGFGMELVVRNVALGRACGAEPLVAGNMFITDSDVVWTPTARAFGGALTGVRAQLEKVLGKPLVVLDVPKAVLEREQAAADVAGYAMGLLSGAQHVCDACVH
jgi:hypothetical protein